MKKNFGTLLVGIVFLIFGGGYVVARLFGYDPPFFFDGWWTLFLMIPALISMVETGLHLGNSIVFVIGLLLLAWEQDWIKNLNFTLILAIVLVMLGVYFIVRAITGSRKKAGASASWNAGNIQWRPSHLLRLLYRDQREKRVPQPDGRYLQRHLRAAPGGSVGSLREP